MNLEAERERLRDHLVRSAEEIRSAEHAGWGNVIDWAITLIDAQASALAEMQERCAKATEGERVESVSNEDLAYNLALEHAARAIRALGKGT